eukprot:scaffold6934_cov125-Skeletonema_menzelii.AAC.1
MSLNNATVFTVPTKGEDSAQKKVIDTSLIKEEDLKTLKKQDPFLYFSIPAVRTAAHLSRDVDMSCLKGGVRSPNASSPSKLKSAPSTKVERKSCISFECHADLILEGLIDDMGNLKVDTEDEFDISSLLAQPRVQPRVQPPHCEKQ